MLKMIRWIGGMYVTTNTIPIESKFATFFSKHLVIKKDR